MYLYKRFTNRPEAKQCNEEKQYSGGVLKHTYSIMSSFLQICSKENDDDQYWITKMVWKQKDHLTWFMPALANRRVGSSRGMVADECTYSCSYRRKKSMNFWRIWAAVSEESMFAGLFTEDCRIRTRTDKIKPLVNTKGHACSNRSC